MSSKLIKGLRNPRGAYNYLFTKPDWRYKARMKYLFWRYDHSEAYRRLMNYRIERFGPEEAVGGFDLSIGELQFEFLREQGLQPDHRLLDIGCGTLRGGQYFIDYLNPGHYTGMDISQEAIDEGIAMLDDAVLTTKDPTFVVNDDLRFQEFAAEPSFDYAIAQSVFTHIPRDYIEECLAHIDTAVDGEFYATFFDEPKSLPKDYGYDPETLVAIAESYGYSASVLSTDEYPHPRDQRMLRVSTTPS